MPTKKGPGKRHRSAVDGRFVKENYAKKHPKTTVSETVEPQKRRKKK